MGRRGAQPADLGSLLSRLRRSLRWVAALYGLGVVVLGLSYTDTFGQPFPLPPGLDALTAKGHLPIAFWGVLWTIAGVIVVVTALADFPRPWTTIGMVCVIAIGCTWGLAYLYGWVATFWQVPSVAIGGNRRGYVATALFAMLILWLPIIIAGLPLLQLLQKLAPTIDPPAAEDTDPEGT